MSDRAAATPPPAESQNAPRPKEPAATKAVDENLTPAPANKQPILRGFVARIAEGEFDPDASGIGKKDFHQFVVKEIYPLLADGTLNADDLAKVAQAYGVRANPEFKTPA
jgi:hypothetical protein